MLLISAKDQKNLNRLIQYVVKKERETLTGCNDIFDVGKRYQCQLESTSRTKLEDISAHAWQVRFIALPDELRTKEVVCKIEYRNDLKTSSEKATVILEILKNCIDYTALWKRFHLLDTIEIKDYVSLRVFMDLFVSKDGGVKIINVQK